MAPRKHDAHAHDHHGHDHHGHDHGEHDHQPAKPGLLARIFGKR